MALASGAIVGIVIGASVAACASAGVAKLLWHERGMQCVLWLFEEELAFAFVSIHFFSACAWCS